MATTKTGIIATVAGAFALIGTVWGSVTIADARYELKEVHEPEHVLIQASFDQMSYTAMKGEIREIRELLFRLNGSDQARKQQLEWDLQDAIDRLCKSFPEDRECTR